VYALNEKKRYTTFTIAKRADGPPRVIDAPIKPIKDMQRQLARHLSAAYEPLANVHGFVSGRSPLSNARQHTDQEWVLRIDLDNFFPTIHFGRVRGMFMKYPFEYSAEVATLLAHICCHRGQLPQGAPTSPIISNLICRSMDRALQKLARFERCFYTRYADDICFSTQRRTFPRALATREPAGFVVIGERLNSVVESNGFLINHEKSRLVRRTQRQRVTGLVVNEYANVSTDYVRELRDLLFIWRRYGKADAAARFAHWHPNRNSADAKAAPRFEWVIGARIQHVGSVRGWTSPTYRRLAKCLQELQPGFEPKTLRVLDDPVTVVLYTEGESDVLHLTAALAAFHAAGEFKELELSVVEKSPSGNDAKLLSMAGALAETQQALPCICVFDRDAPAMVERAVGPTGSRVYGNGVAAIAIAPPPWRSEEDRVCIEMLYADEDLARRDENDRRIYVLSEFDGRSGQHLSEEVNTPNVKNNTLVRDEVFAFGTRESKALGKLAFAKAVADKTPPFDAVSFEGFRKTFELLQETAARILSDTSP
jgi:RNA-directed DNA polymerase